MPVGILCDGSDNIAVCEIPQFGDIFIELVRFLLKGGNPLFKVVELVLDSRVVVILATAKQKAEEYRTEDIYSFQILAL